MTADAIPSSGSHSPAEGRRAAVVRMIRESFQAVTDRADEVTKFFYSMLFSIDPPTRDLFPANMETQRDRLLQALVHIVQQVDKPEELNPYLEQLARDHRKFGVLTKHYESVGIALIAAVKRHAGDAWSDDVERAWAEAYTSIARVMQEATVEDSGPAWWNAEVIEHRRISTDLAAIRVRADYPMRYEAGQYVSVETPQRPRMWRYLSPASAPSDDGIMEFHVRAVEGGWVSRGIVAHTAIGDTWKLASPIGRLRVDRENGRDVLLVAGGTGIAPIRSNLEALAEYGENPHVHLFYGARHADELYELDNLRRLTDVAPWFELTAVAEEGAEERYGIESGNLAEVVTSAGSWADRDAFLAGSPAMLRATISRMLVAGTPLDQIHYDPFTMS